LRFTAGVAASCICQNLVAYSGVKKMGSFAKVYV